MARCTEERHDEPVKQGDDDMEQSPRTVEGGNDLTPDEARTREHLAWMGERNGMVSGAAASVGVASFVELVDAHAAVVMAARK